MTIYSDLSARLRAALADPELTRLSPGLSLGVDIILGQDGIGLSFSEGEARLVSAGAGTVRIVAQEADWAQTLKSPPPPTFHSFTAFQIANPAFAVEGDAEAIATARPVLERLFELVTATPVAQAPAVRRDIAQITGKYAPVQIGGREHLVYFETAGVDGPPVLFLHTAGADGRQYLPQLADVELAARYRLFAIDLPFHGKSLPPDDWDGGPYLLTSDLYRDWCSAFIEQVIGERAIIVGGSMGAAMALVMAAERPALTVGIVALEPPFRSKGRRNPYQNHVRVHGGLHNGAYVRGLMSPTSPISQRRRASWIYSQGAPGVYPGDLAFYSDEFDGAITGPQIDAGRTPIALLSGTYDYSATPADGARLAAHIPGALHLVMEGLGHFPATEHPDLFRPWLIEGLNHVTA